MSWSDARIVGSRVDADKYHLETGKRGDAKFILSPSSLREFRQCPQRWRDGYVPPSSEAKRWGSIIDCLILTPEMWVKKFVVQPESVTATGNMECVKNEEVQKGDLIPWRNCKEAQDWNRDHAGLEILSATEWGQASDARARFLRDEMLASLVEDSDKQVHVSAHWTDEKTGLVIPCQCLIDLVPRLGTEWHQCLADWKTTRSAHPLAFREFAFKQKYHIQAAFDMDMYCAVAGEDRNTWLWALQENFPPYQTGHDMVSPMEERFGYLEMGRLLYQHTLAMYARCLASDHWAGYDENGVQGWTPMRPTQRHQDQTLMDCEQPTESEPETTPEESSPESEFDIIP